jgi:predicted transcriptional regulator
MSPRAACRLESLGYEDVYDYAPGKSDWLASGLTREGDSQKEAYAGDHAHPTVTCGPQESIADVRDRVLAEKKDICLVVDHDEHVLGALYGDTLNKDGASLAEDVMDGAPQTFRANEPLKNFTEERAKKDVKTVIVTTPHGRLLGVVERDELEAHVQATKP